MKSGPRPGRIRKGHASSDGERQSKTPQVDPRITKARHGKLSCQVHQSLGTEKESLGTRVY